MDESRLMAYYEGRFAEGERLRTREGQLEFERAKEILQRYLPTDSARVIDIGGGTGVYAAWLAALGHDVHLVDIVASHVATAAAIGGFTASVADARSLPDSDRSYDVALMMGPLYHLPSRQDRIRALRECFRVVRPGGLLAIMFISRIAIPLDAFVKGWVDRDRGPAGLEYAVSQGHDPGGGFGAVAYFHLPNEIEGELREAELEICDLFGLEGPGWIAADFDVRWGDESRRKTLLDIARQVECRPEFLPLSPHLLAIARRPSDG